MQIANKHMKISSASLDIKEMQIKPQLDMALYLWRWLQSTTETTASVGEDAEKLEPS